MGFSILFKTELTTTGVFPLLEVMLSEIQGFNANPNLNFFSSWPNTFRVLIKKRSANSFFIKSIYRFQVSILSKVILYLKY